MVDAMLSVETRKTRRRLDLSDLTGTHTHTDHTHTHSAVKLLR